MNMNYHISETSVKCPYCNKDCEDVDYEVAYNMDNKIEYECEYCEKKFWAAAKISYDTHADCSLNGKDHDWYYPNKEKFKTLMNCKNCPEFKCEVENENDTHQP